MTQSNRLADATIPASVAIPLMSPANPVTTFRTIERVLAASKVPFGLEEPALSSAPLFDFAHPPVEIRKLSGMRLGDALDAIARELPLVRWTEQDGLIVVRLGPSPAPFLDRRLPRLSIASLSLAGALDVVVATAEPARQVREVAGTPATGTTVSLERENVTTLEALNALAKAASGSSIVQYDDAAGDAEGATVILRTAAGSYSAASPVALRARQSPDPHLVRVTMPAELPDAIVRYASAAHVTVGINALARRQGILPEPTGIAVPLDSTKPAEAISTLVAYDTRYTWSETVSAFRVEPKREPASALSWLDAPVEKFSASNEPLAAVLDRVIWLSGLAPGSTLNVIVSGPVNTAETDAKRQEIARTPVTVAFDRRGTVADVLDALGRAGGLSWVAQPISPSFPDVQLRLVSPEGWSMSRMVPVPASVARPTAAPVRRVPPARDYRIGRTDLPIGQGAMNPFEDLMSREGRLPMGLEVAPAVFESRDRRVTQPYVRPVTVGPGLFSDAVYVLLERFPEYELHMSDGVMDIAPATLLQSPTHFLNLPIDHFEVRDLPILDALDVLRHRMNPEYPEHRPRVMATSILGSSAADTDRRFHAAQAILDRRVTVVVDHAPPREILDRLAAANGDLRWVVQYHGPSPTEAPEPIEANCTITFATFPDIGISYAAGPIPAPRSTATPPAVTPAIPRTGPNLQVVLPTSPNNLRLALQMMASRLRVPIGAVVIQPGQTRAEMQADADARTNGVHYDLTGLSVSLGLDKILETMPAYTWRNDGGVYHVVPRQLSTSVLDRPVEHLDAQLASVDEALALVLSLVDRQSPAKRTPPNRPPQIQALTNRPMHVVVDNGTIRDVLDELAHRHGALAWLATLSDPSGATGRILITLQGFDGWGVSSSTEIR